MDRFYLAIFHTLFFVNDGDNMLIDLRLISTHNVNTYLVVISFVHLLPFLSRQGNLKESLDSVLGQLKKAIENSFTVSVCLLSQTCFLYLD